MHLSGRMLHRVSSIHIFTLNHMCSLIYQELLDLLNGSLLDEDRGIDEESDDPPSIEKATAKSHISKIKRAAKGKKIPVLKTESVPKVLERQPMFQLSNKPCTSKVTIFCSLPKRSVVGDRSSREAPNKLSGSILPSERGKWPSDKSQTTSHRNIPFGPIFGSGIE